jgi:hypothetical protein
MVALIDTLYPLPANQPVPTDPHDPRSWGTQNRTFIYDREGKMISAYVSGEPPSKPGTELVFETIKQLVGP